jgi:DNA-binding NarL/FixJ family response regulator
VNATITADDLTAARLLGHQEGRRFAEFFNQDAAALVARLTVREREILIMLGKGLNRDQAVSALNMSKTTLDTHRANALATLGVETNIEAAVILAKAGAL